MSFPILENDVYLEFKNKLKLFKDKVKTYINKQTIKDPLLFTPRSIKEKEIDTFSNIYLMPKLYLFYSKILYNYSLNTQKYYNIYNESYNIYKNMNKYYLSTDNPFIKKVNIVINNKKLILSDKKKINEIFKEIDNNKTQNITILKNILDNFNNQLKDINKKMFDMNENISLIQKIHGFFDNITNINLTEIINILSKYNPIFTKIKIENDFNNKNMLSIIDLLNKYSEYINTNNKEIQIVYPDYKKYMSILNFINNKYIEIIDLINKINLNNLKHDIYFIEDTPENYDIEFKYNKFNDIFNIIIIEEKIKNLKEQKKSINIYIDYINNIINKLENRNYSNNNYLIFYKNLCDNTKKYIIYDDKYFDEYNSSKIQYFENILINIKLYICIINYYKIEKNLFNSICKKNIDLTNNIIFLEKIKEEIKEINNIVKLNNNKYSKKITEMSENYKIIESTLDKEKKDLEENKKLLPANLIITKITDKNETNITRLENNIETYIQEKKEKELEYEKNYQIPYNNLKKEEKDLEKIFLDTEEFIIKKYWKNVVSGVSRTPFPLPAPILPGSASLPTGALSGTTIPVAISGGSALVDIDYGNDNRYHIIFKKNGYDVKLNMSNINEYFSSNDFSIIGRGTSARSEIETNLRNIMDKYNPIKTKLNNLDIDGKKISNAIKDKDTLIKREQITYNKKVDKLYNEELNRLKSYTNYEKKINILDKKKFFYNKITEYILNEIKKNDIKNNYDKMNNFINNSFKSIKEYSININNEINKYSIKNKIQLYFENNILFKLLFYKKNNSNSIIDTKYKKNYNKINNLNYLSTSSTDYLDENERLEYIFSILSKLKIFNNNFLKKSEDDKNLNYNENFINTISDYLANDNKFDLSNFFIYLKEMDLKFVTYIKNLLYEYNNKNNNLLIKILDNNKYNNIYNKLKTIINNRLILQFNKNKNKNKKYINTDDVKYIFPYTDFIICYFTLYLIIINSLLYYLGQNKKII